MGYPGLLRFDEPELRSLLLDGLWWDPADPIDTTISTETLAAPVLMEEAVADIRVRKAGLEPLPAHRPERPRLPVHQRPRCPDQVGADRRLGVAAPGTRPPARGAADGCAANPRLRRPAARPREPRGPRAPSSPRPPRSRGPRLPAELLLRLAGSATTSSMSAGRASSGSIRTWSSALQVDAGEGRVDEVPDRVRDAGADHEVVRLVPLEHQPHRLDVLLRVAPVPADVEVAQDQLVAQAELDPGDALADPTGDEGRALAGATRG